MSGYPAVRSRPMALDPGTSSEAHARQTPARVDLVKSMILGILARHGARTDEEIADLYEAERFLNPQLPDISPSSLRTRRHALVVQGLVRDTGQTGTTRYGSRAVKWDVHPDFLNTIGAAGV